MPLGDPSSWAEGLGALKTGFEALRSAIGMVKDVRRSFSDNEQKVIDAALTVATTNTAAAEAKLAAAWLRALQVPVSPDADADRRLSSHVGPEAARRVSPCLRVSEGGFNTAGPSPIRGPVLCGPQNDMLDIGYLVIANVTQCMRLLFFQIDKDTDRCSEIDHGSF